jgi:hypothetical protein
MLLGAELHISTNHKNILNVGNLFERRLCWISYVDEYGPTLHYIEGPRNVIADTFSKRSRKDVPSSLVGKKVAHIVSNSESNNEIESLRSSLTDDKEILECLLYLPCISSDKKQKKRHTKCKKLITENHCRRRRRKRW